MKSKFVFVLLISLFTVDAFAQSFSLCNNPYEKPVIDQDPVLKLQYCTAPDPCYKAATPNVVGTPFTRAQGEVVEADTPAEFEVDRAKWWVLDDQDNLIYVHETTEGLPVTDGEVQFGAPGLEKAGSYQYRVSFRRSSNGKWTCLSDRSVLSSTSSSFTGAGPDKPPLTEILVEDDFRRPETIHKVPLSGDPVRA